MWIVSALAVMAYTIPTWADDVAPKPKNSPEVESFGFPQSFQLLEKKYQELQRQLEISEARNASALESARIALDAVKDSNEALQNYMQILLAMMAVALAIPVVYIVAGIERRIRHRVDQRYEKIEDEVVRAIEAIVFDNKTAFDSAESHFHTGVLNFQSDQKDTALKFMEQGLSRSEKLKWIFDPRKPRFGGMLEWERKIQEDQDFWRKYKSLWSAHE